VTKFPALKTYRIFISHAWDYNDEYYRFERLLKQTSLFEWTNYSVPNHNPLGTKTDRDLREALNRQIRPVNIVIILAGMYVVRSKWIQIEMNIAQSMNKPMIGIIPHGGQRTPRDVQDVVRVMIRWNTSSIVNAIRQNSI